MPLVLDHSKLVFLHPAKTGGTWVRNALTRAGVSWSDYGNQHANFEDAKELYPRSPRFTIVRNPFYWYASYWAYKQYEGWKGNWVLGMGCADDDFNQFIKLVCQEHPGFLTDLLGGFTGGRIAVLRNESLSQGLRQTLISAGEQFNESKLLLTPRANPGACLPWFTEKVKYARESIEAILSSEKRLFLKYGYPENLPAANTMRVT